MPITTTIATAMDPSLTLASASPYPYTFPLRRTALLLIDIQRDFVDPDGFGAIQCGDPAVFAGVRRSVVPAATAGLAAARTLGLHVVHTREGHRADLADLSAAKRDRQLAAPAGHHTLGIGDEGPMGRLLVRGQHGHDLVDELRPRPGEVVVDKPGKGAFWSSSLHRKLMARGVTHLLVAGVTTECCVTTTAREANDRGFQCCVLGDCTGGFDAGFGAASLAMISAYDGLFGFTATSSAELLKAAADISANTSTPTPPITPPESRKDGAAATPLGTANSWDPATGPLDLSTLGGLYREQALRPEDIIRAVYARVQAYEHQNPHIWILLRPLDDLIDEAKRLADRYPDRQCLPPLFGVPFAVKDNFDVAPLPTTAACPAYAYTPAETCPTVASLQAAGALLVGKTNMDQLATGLSGRWSPHGAPASVFGGGSGSGSPSSSSSPGGPEYVPGGSSSGSAVAVAAHLVTFALGTDTGGSGRVPAAFNGIVGYKPTKGTLSSRGIVPACRSLDTVSVFAETVGDARRVWYVLDDDESNTKEDAYAKDPASLPLALADYRGVRGAGFAFGVPPRDVLERACPPAYLAAFERALTIVEAAMGGQRRSLTAAEYRPFQAGKELLYGSTLANERIACIGAEFVLASLDKNSKDDSDTCVFHPTTHAVFRQVVERGATSKPWDVFADLARQREATQQVARLMQGPGLKTGGVDVLLVPTAPFHPTIATMEADPLRLNVRMGEFVYFGNVLDLCAISVPAGSVDDGVTAGLPFGLSFVCARGMDGYLFDLATEFERALETRKA